MTNADRTNYYQAAPSNQIEMILFLEADRMRGLEIAEENVNNQRNARMNAVTAEDVQRVARQYYDPARLQIVAVGDAAKIKDAPAKYGAV